MQEPSVSSPRTIDLTGMRCPGPIVRLNAEIRATAAGEIIEAVSDDLAFEPDVEAWCRRTGHELLAIDRRNGRIAARIRSRA